MADTYATAILAHYEKHWGPGLRKHRWHLGPIHQLPEAFCVLESAPHDSRDMWAYGTCGMSKPEDCCKREIFIYAPESSEQHVELLTIVAHYHLTGGRLDHFHTINFGRPWLPGSTCSFGLLSWPYLEPAEFSICWIAPDNEARFIWLIPITETERDYKKNAGLDALEGAFEKVGLNYLDPFRKSVI